MRRIRRFLLWLLPARRVRIDAGPRVGPQELGGWDDLPYDGEWLEQQDR